MNMILLQQILIGLVALLHVYFLALEMFFWKTPYGLKVFGMTLEKANATAVLAANQGLYNGFLVAGLVWSFFYPDELVSKQLALFFLSCVFIAGLYGGYSVSYRILLVQGVPALLAIALLLCNRV